jgi:hypothetical protein
MRGEARAPSGARARRIRAGEVRAHGIQAGGVMFPQPVHASYRSHHSRLRVARAILRRHGQSPYPQPL